MMAATAQLLLVCASALSFTPACARMETTPATNAAAPPVAAIVYTESADPVVLTPEEQTEAALDSVRRADRDGREADGQLSVLTPQEHMRRGAIYHANRAFEEARAHWRTVLARYASDPNAPMALFLIGRSLFQERRYEEALPHFERLGAESPGTRRPRRLLLRRRHEAAPRARRRGRAALHRVRRKIPRRRAGRTVIPEHHRLPARGRPPRRGHPVGRAHAPALHRDGHGHERAVCAPAPRRVARRLAVGAPVRDELSRPGFQRGVATSRTRSRTFAPSPRTAGRREEAAAAYRSIPDSLSSYFGGLATARLREFGGEARTAAAEREARVRSEAQRAAADYPVPFREIILRAVRGRAVDPRLMLAIMRQESGFKPMAKSGAGARGMMHLTETPQKYGRASG